MASNGGEDGLKSAMRILLSQSLSSKYLLQASPQDITTVIPFADSPKAVWTVDGNSPTQFQALDAKINRLQAGGGTDNNTPVIQGLRLIAQQHSIDRFPAVILMTDGVSNTGATLSDLKAAVAGAGFNKVPVYAILFGDASTRQLSKIASLTSGQIFDGRKDLITAFRSAKGYN
jgi:Ca-activated chloride channel family protein